MIYKCVSLYKAIDLLVSSFIKKYSIIQRRFSIWRNVGNFNTNYDLFK